MDSNQEKIRTLLINKLNHEGRGIAHWEGKIQFIDNALPGETVSAELRKAHKKYDELIAHEINHPNSDRVAPPCPHYLICGGCRLQHLAPPAQIALKQSVLQEQLQHIGHCAPRTLLPALQAKTLGYRRKARLGVRYAPSKKTMFVGFRQLDDFDIADLKTCPVLDPKLDALIPELSHLVGRLSNFQSIVHIECAMGDEAAAIIIRHLRPFMPVDLERLTQFAQTYEVAVYLQPDKPDSIIKLWPHDKQNLLHYTLPKYDLNLAFHPADFTQVNTDINRLMIDQALQLLALDEKDHVLDLFCGIGNFTLPMARFAKKVIGIEGNASMIDKAKYNAKINHMKNIDFRVADLTKQFDVFKKCLVNKILLDPPRVGALEVLPQLVALAPERIVYISCNPSTLARDAQYLTANGYSLDQAGVMDMFPHTQHVESMALFLRCSAAAEACHPTA